MEVNALQDIKLLECTIPLCSCSYSCSSQKGRKVIYRKRKDLLVSKQPDVLCRFRYTDIQVPLRCHSSSLHGQRTKSGNQKSGPVRLLVMNNQLDVLCKPEMYFHPSANRDRKQTLEKPFAGNIAVSGMAWHGMQIKANIKSN